MRLALCAGLLCILAAVVWLSLQTSQAPDLTTARVRESPTPASASIRDCAACPELLRAPAGAFMMGSPATELHRNDNESPRQRIVIAKPYLLGRFEITRAEFETFVDAAKYARPPSAQAPHEATDTWRRPGFSQWDTHPVVGVTYEDAEAYVGWLTRTTGHAYRIASEAEWESAARAGSNAPYAWIGDERSACTEANVADIAFHVWAKGPSGDIAPCNDRFPQTAPVGSYAPNAWGFHDMIGNALEWTSDCWSDTLASQPANGAPRTTGDCNRHALRGGSWLSQVQDNRIARRIDARIGYTEFNIGFRVARDE